MLTALQVPRSASVSVARTIPACYVNTPSSISLVTQCRGCAGSAVLELALHCPALSLSERLTGLLKRLFPLEHTQRSILCDGSAAPTAQPRWHFTGNGVMATRAKPRTAACCCGEAERTVRPGWPDLVQLGPDGFALGLNQFGLKFDHHKDPVCGRQSQNFNDCRRSSSGKYSQAGCACFPAR